MIDKKQLLAWCKVTLDDLKIKKDSKIPFQIVKNSAEMGHMMARDFVEDIKKANAENRVFRAIVPCGPKCWYEPFAKIVNDENVSLHNLFVFHMDECLDWQGKLLHKNDPYNFRTFMETYFYGPIKAELQVPQNQRFFPEPATMEYIKTRINEAPIDLTLGGWGQDGHIAYNQARRHPYCTISIEELKNAEMRIQENNWDTIITLAQRSFGAAYQFVPPMSITLGIKECLSAKKVRLYSDTGSWKQTAFRVALFSEIVTEYPITLLQEHANAMIIATEDTADHPLSHNSNWEFNF